MVDDPRGHDDGDVFSGSADGRREAIDMQMHAFLDDLGETEGFSPDDLIALCHRAIEWIRECKARVP